MTKKAALAKARLFGRAGAEDCVADSATGGVDTGGLDEVDAAVDDGVGETGVGLLGIGVDYITGNTLQFPRAKLPIRNACAILTPCRTSISP
jgi:hypothetical protein